MNYIGVGPIYNTNSKSDASNPIGEKRLKDIIIKTNLPVVAIGGIALNNIENLFATDYLDGGGNTRSTQLGGEDVDIGEGRNYMASIQFEY